METLRTKAKKRTTFFVFFAGEKTTLQSFIILCVNESLEQVQSLLSYIITPRQVERIHFNIMSITQHLEALLSQESTNTEQKVNCVSLEFRRQFRRSCTKEPNVHEIASIPLLVEPAQYSHTHNLITMFNFLYSILLSARLTTAQSLENCYQKFGRPRQVTRRQVPATQTRQ